MPLLPLITHQHADAPFAWRDGAPVSAGRFLMDVATLAATLPEQRHMLNSCGDRYRFAVGLGAALVRGKVCLLPSTQTPEMIRQMALFAPDAFCLTDDSDCAVALPQLRFPAMPESNATAASFSVPHFDGGQLVAYVFTSGSTGAPVPHPKTWGSLVVNVKAEAQLCGLSDGRRHTVVGTVPPQHMYGFESTVLIVMQSANAMFTGKSFYPADICSAIASAPAPRMLVSTPVHMKSVIHAQLDAPTVELVMSATAPLSAPLAVDLEKHFGAPLLEIYGSTETGQIALRHSTRTQEWQLFPGLQLTQQHGVTTVCGGHVERPTELNDVIEVVDDKRFLLHGRTADLVNIAGKRNSLAYLNLQLNAIDGVVDGAFYMPDEKAGDGVTRLSAFVVAPGLSAATLLAALRERIDPVFLPRPLAFVNALPRNATGKLPRAALTKLAHDYARPAGREPA